MSKIESKTENKTVYVLIIILFCCILLLDIMAVSNVFKYMKIFEELLEGEPLPYLTKIVVENRWALLIIDAVPLFLIAGFLFKRNRKYVILTIQICSFILIIKMSLTYIAINLPLMSIVQKIGG
jgi:hypothetical protein